LIDPLGEGIASGWDYPSHHEEHKGIGGQVNDHIPLSESSRWLVNVPKIVTNEMPVNLEFPHAVPKSLIK
jgi:hypothetical protein